MKVSNDHAILSTLCRQNTMEIIGKTMGVSLVIGHGMDTYNNTARGRNFATLRVGSNESNLRNGIGFFYYFILVKCYFVV